MYNKPRIPKNVKSQQSKRQGMDWPSQSPFKAKRTPEYGEGSVGEPTKSIFVDSNGKAVITPEWYHGNV